MAADTGLMGTWEDRMAAAAHERWLKRYKAEQAALEAERAAYERQCAQEQRAEFEGGPPGGCYDCYAWGPDFFSNSYRWWHVTIDEGDCTCYHACHGDSPVPCAPVVIG